MDLIPPDIYMRLLRNGEVRRNRAIYGFCEIDFMPVVKLFTPHGGCTWLLTEVEPDDTDIAFGLCDLGMGYPELGSVSLSELASVKGPLGPAVERDLHFIADRTLKAYADEAMTHRFIRA